MASVDRVTKGISSLVRRVFAKEPGTHDWGHIERVLALCEHLRAEEGGDAGVIRLAALLHDLGRTTRFKKRVRLRGHAARGAVIARGILGRRGVEPRVIDAVAHCITAHSYRGRGRPHTIEAKILFDADKLDSIGAIGVGRAFMFASELGAVAHNSPGIDILGTKMYSRQDSAYREYLFKLRHIKDRLFTKEGRRFARGRNRFMKQFFQQIEAEVRGLA